MMVVKPVFIVMVCVVFLMFSFSVCLSDEWGTVSFQKDESDSIQELEQAFDGTSHPAFLEPFNRLDRLWFYDGLVMPGTYGLYGSITQLPLANRTFLPASEKDPFIAGLLSWFMMGMGQIYAHEYTKGSIFIAANLASKLSLVLLISHINTKYSPGGNEIINIDWKSFDSSTKFLIIGYFATSFGLRVYNVVDAVKSAREYNERFFSQKGENGFSFSIDPERVSINLSFD
jgi:hypothetical protein